MKKLINARNSIIVILCITIICLGIGFIVLSVKLNTYKERKDNYNVSFIEVSPLTTISGGKTPPTCTTEVSKDGQLINMNFTLNNARDELVYTATIQNNGTLPVVIVDVLESPEYSTNYKDTITPVTITKSDVSGKVLAPGDATDLKIDVTYNYSTIKGTKKINYKLGLLTKEEN